MVEINPLITVSSSSSIYSPSVSSVLSSPSFTSDPLSSKTYPVSEKDYLKYRHGMGRLFEDDVIFCPRSLLTPSERLESDEFDRMFSNGFICAQMAVSGSAVDIYGIPRK